MSRRLTQLPCALALAACGASPIHSPAPSRSRSRRSPRSNCPGRWTSCPEVGVPVTMMALVTEKAGSLWLIDMATGHKQEVAGVPGFMQEGQGGLADVVAHPGFAGNQRVYLSFPEAGPDGTSGAVVGYGRLILGQGQPHRGASGSSGARSRRSRRRLIIRERIAFAPDGTMFVSSGERFKFDPAQDPNSDLGKIIHMTATKVSASAGRYLLAGPSQRARPRLRARRAPVGDARWDRGAATRST